MTLTPVSQREPGQPGLALVEPAVGRAGALGVHAEQLALVQNALRGDQCGLRGVGVGAVDGHLPGRGVEPALEPALEAGAGEVLGLGQEGDPAPDHQRQVEAVRDGQVVTGEDDRHRSPERIPALRLSGRPSSVSSGPMKMYLNSQYHMDPPAIGRTGRCSATTVPTHVYAPRLRLVTLRRSTGMCWYRPGPDGGGSGGSGGGSARPGRAAGAGRWRPVIVDHRAHDGQQRDAVLGDDRQQRVLLAGHQRGQRTHRAPHLLALAGLAVGAGARPRPRTAGSIRSRIVCASCRSSGPMSPCLGPRLQLICGHTSGLGRNRTVSSLPSSWASITMHRRRTDASRTRRRMPPAPMIRSSSTRPSVSALGVDLRQL